MGLCRGGFSYEPIADNASEALPLQQRAWARRRALRKNIGTVIMCGASLGALAAFWGSTRTSLGTNKPPSSPSPTPPASAAADASFVVLPTVSDAAALSTSSARLMKQVRVFTESYRGSTNTTRYGALIAEPHRENTLEVDVGSSNLDDDVELR